MANIVINEISQNYSYNIGANSYACVAMPITSCWGPGYFKPENDDAEEMLEATAWSRFPATQEGLESFVATYRGAATNYRLANDYSYQMAMTLLTAGYDVLACRICPGKKASGKLQGYTVLTEEPADWAESYVNYYTVVNGKLIKLEDLDHYDVLTSKPDDWDDNYASYFVLSGEEYVAVEPVQGYKLLTSQPSDWSSNYNSYFISDGAGGYTEVTGVEAYEVLTSEPADWSTNYSDYYVSDGADSYVHVTGVDDYVAVASGATKPDDWDSTWNTDYYTSDGQGGYVLNSESTWTAAKSQAGGLYTKQIIAPAFSSGTYFERTVVAPTFESNTYYEYTDVAPIFVDGMYYKFVDETVEFEAGKYYEQGESEIAIEAKYPGTFGNDLRVQLTKSSYKAFEGSKIVDKYFWSLVVYIVDPTGIKSAVENKTFVFNIDDSTDNILYWEEVESNYVTIKVTGDIEDSDTAAVFGVDGFVFADLEGGSDWMEVEAETTSADLIAKMQTLAAARFSGVLGTGTNYISAIAALANKDVATVNIYYNMEWVYTQLVGTRTFDGVFSLLKDKLAYNPNRVISPGWDDQNIVEFTGAVTATISEPSPIHVKLMDVAYYSRCATAYIDAPYSLARADVYKTGDEEGYAQMLSRFAMNNLGAYDINLAFYSTHSALFAPWGQYTYVGTSRSNLASPSFLTLMIERAQILNQAIQYEWALPTNRRHNLKISKLQYSVPKKILDVWQPSEGNGGVGVNAITTIPDLGVNIWGNSTLYDLPPATYQALANLSTRKLVNAVEDVAYRCGIAITFQYNNRQAYSSFYAGVTPILDTMRNVGAIDDYYVKMSADINGLDHVNANSVIGKIYLVINGVINDIYIDLIALPQGTNLDQFRS